LFTPSGRAQGSSARAVDPRFLSYRGLLADIAAAKDSVAASAEARERQALFASVADLAVLERELDQMERVLAAQQTGSDRCTPTSPDDSAPSWWCC
jgi:hypothetical protein